MAEWLEEKYVDLACSHYPNFKRTKETTRFSCPYCDEYNRSKSKRKARGYFLSSGGSLHYYCHRCGKSASFRQFMRDLHPTLYDEYIKEFLLENKTTKRSFTRPTIPKKVIELVEDPLRTIQKVSRLDDSHYAKQYVVSRKIPAARMTELYYAPKFVEWIESIDSKIQCGVEHDRLVIPFFNGKGFHALQGRAFGDDIDPKYLTIMIDENIPAIYGLERVDRSRTVFVFEGPIDAMFIDNSIATAGGDLSSKLDRFSNDNIVIVYDNERRSKHTIDKIARAIDRGFAVCIWPDDIKEKDVNAMIIAGMTAQDIQRVINENIYRGLAAKLKLNQWRKV